jgi:hypothetical protein
MTRRYRVAIALFAGMSAVLWAGPARAGAQQQPPRETFFGRAEAVGLFSAIDVPPLLDTNTIYSASEGTNESAYGIYAAEYPGFLIRFVMSDNKVPTIPGTVEIRYPEGPTEAGSSPGPFLSSSGKSGPDGVSGSTRTVGQEAQGGGVIGLGEASSSVRATAEEVRSDGQVALQNVNLGGGAFFVRQVLASASAVASKTGQGKALGSVELTGVTASGTPVVVTPRGVKLGNAGGEFPPSDGVDSVLAGAGITIRRLPERREVQTDGTESLFEVGGIEVTVKHGESSTTYILGRVQAHAKGLWSAESGSATGGTTAASPSSASRLESGVAEPWTSGKTVHESVPTSFEGRMGGRTMSDVNPVRARWFWTPRMCTAPLCETRLVRRQNLVSVAWW